MPLAEPRSPADAPQTARADLDDASDADLSTTETGDDIAWWPAVDEPYQRPSRLPGYIPGQTPEPISQLSAAPTPEPTLQSMPEDMPKDMPVESHGQTTLTSTPGDYTVQFASYTSEERAWRGWDALQSAASDLLSVIKPNVQRADLGEDAGIVYRLRTVPTPRAVADRLCGALKSRGVDCLVMKSEPSLADSGLKGPA